MGKFRAVEDRVSSEEVLEDQFDSPEDGLELESNFPIIASSSQSERIIPAKRAGSDIVRPVAAGHAKSGSVRGERNVVVRAMEILSDDEGDSELEVFEYEPRYDKGKGRTMEEADSEEERELTLDVSCRCGTFRVTQLTDPRSTARQRN